MDNFDVRSAKLIGIFVIVILLVVGYLGYISNAYEKRSANVKQEAVVQDTKTEEIKEDSKQEEYTEEVVEEEKYEKTGTLYRDDSFDFDEEKKEKKQFKELEPIEDVADIKSEQNIGADELSKVLSEAAENQANKNYEVAVNAYKKAVELTDDKFVKADCYEALADIFAQTKKYGSAMGYAQKAYNIKSTPKRDFMLAKLYYKTGSTERALQKAEEIFKKDFTE